jgi:hypothetical protein
MKSYTVRLKGQLYRIFLVIIFCPLASDGTFYQILEIQIQKQSILIRFRVSE